MGGGSSWLAPNQFGKANLERHEQQVVGHMLRSLECCTFPKEGTGVLD